MDQPSRITLRDIAEKIGISVMTVSLALREHPKIPSLRREEIRKVAETMGYRPNPNAAALARQKRHSMSHSVRAELAWINHWREPQKLRSYKEFDAYWRGATAAAERYGFSLEEFVIDSNLSFARLDKILQARRVQGILIPPHGGVSITEISRDTLDWSRYSVVRFGYSIPDLPAHVVAGNHIQSALLACEKIQKQGYGRIGYTCFPSSSVRCKAGFFLFQMSRPPSERLPVHIVDRELSRRENLRLLDEWVRQNRPDVIFSEIADMRSMLEELGYRVPEEMGLATTSVLDGNVDAGIDQHSEQIGAVAVETLLELIYRNDIGLPNLTREVLVEAGWRDGETLPERRKRTADRN